MTMPDTRMVCGKNVRIYRWDGAPNFLRQHVVAAHRTTRSFDWLAWVPAHRLPEADERHGWTDILKTPMPDGSVLVTGNRRGGSGG